jgi:nucleotide-binding universal stress UspA family protein
VPAKEIIVCPTDFSERSDVALPWVKRLLPAGGELHVVYVVEEPHIYASLDMGPIPIPSIDELTKNAEKRMNTFVAEHLSGAGSVVKRVLVGRPAEAIVAYAREKQATLIVMTTHGYSGVRHVLLGSTTEAVLRHASCPVLSIRSI